MEVSICFGTSSALGTSIIAQTNMPWPIVTFFIMWVLGMVACYYLPKGGRFLKKVNQINESVIRGDIDLYMVNTTYFEGASNMTYGELYIEKKMSAMRASRAMTNLDPDMYDE